MNAMIKRKYVEIAKCEMITIRYNTVIDNQEVEFVASGEATNKLVIEFFINDSTKKRELSKVTKLKITKYLLACWEDIKTLHKYGFCCNADGGKHGWRFNIYNKLGFKYNLSTQYQEYSND